MHQINTKDIIKSNGYYVVPCGQISFRFPELTQRNHKQHWRNRFQFDYMASLFSEGKINGSLLKKDTALIRMEKIVACTNAKDYARIFSDEMLKSTKYKKWRNHPYAEEAARTAINALLIHWGEYLEGNNDWHQDGYEYLCDLLIEFQSETGIYQFA